MTQTGDVWSAAVPAAQATTYYGYRVWGPNWPYDPAWTPGSLAGWITDVDGDGNRMNPNKVVFDPYAEELSHDPTSPAQPTRPRMRPDRTAPRTRDRSRRRA